MPNSCVHVSAKEQSRNIALAMDIAFYEKFNEKKTYAWLSWRETIIDPTNSLNQNPLLTILVLDKWLAAKNYGDPKNLDTRRWVQQLFNACVAWNWSENSTSTEPYYRFGQMLHRSNCLDVVEDFARTNNTLQQLMDWCEKLENRIRPTLSASIAYQLEDGGVVLHSPQSAILDALCTRLLTESTAQEGMDFLWCSPKARTLMEYSHALTRCLPNSLPAAIEYGLLGGGMYDKSLDDVHTHACVFNMHPSRSETAKWLNALTVAYNCSHKPNATMYEKSVWHTMSQAWPMYTNLMDVSVMMHGLDSLIPQHVAYNTLLHYVNCIQQRESNHTLEVSHLLETILDTSTF